MRLKASFFRFALGLVAFLAPLAVLITLMPAIINAEPVKKRLLMELRDWTGGEVALDGPVAIESFFSLSLRARNVSFRGMKGVLGVKQVEAGQLVARISWIGLFSGRLEFDKVKIDDARVAMAAMDRAKAEDALRLLIAAPAHTPFTDFLVSDTIVTLEGEGGAAGETIELHNFGADVDRTPERVSLRAEIGWRGEVVSVRGTVEGKRGAPAGGALGSFRLALSGSGAAARYLGAPFETLIRGTTQISGGYDLAGPRLELRDVEYQSGLARASGDLTIVGTANGPKIEGSLAVPELDLDRIWPGDGLDEQALATLFGAHSVDLRLSADRIAWRGVTTGAAAFTLTGSAGRLVSEIAHLDLMGGSLLGHADAEFTGGLMRARTRLTAENLDARQLVALGLDGEWLAGLADINLEGETTGRAAEELRKNMRGKLRASFPEGGRMRFDPIRLAGTLSAQGIEGWDSVDLSWRDFADLRFEMSLGDEHLRFIELTLTTETGAVKGHGDVDLGSRDLDWRLDVVPGSAGAVAQGAEERPDLGLSITGSWERPSIRLGRRSSRADGGDKVGGEIRAADGRL